MTVMRVLPRRYVPGGDADIILELYEEAGRIICGVFMVDGRLQLPPKAWLRTMRAELKLIEDEARKAGCAELRIAGRNWSRIFPDYEPFEGAENGLRKAL